jgi:hypothetical protein
MGINYKERAEYRTREILINVQNINNWIKENPSVSDANMWEIMNYLIELGWILSDLRKYNNDNDINELPSNIEQLINEMKFMLLARKEFLNDFTNKFGIKAMWEDYLKRVFSGNIEYKGIEKDNKEKELLCKEMGVLGYIYGVQRNEPDYVYDNKLEFEEMTNAVNSLQSEDIMPQVLIKIIENNYNKESTKGHLKESNKSKCYDQIIFSSPEEEKEYIKKSTEKFSIYDCFVNHEESNALIILDQDNEYCLEPVDIHMTAAMKLYRTIHNVETDIDIEEALGFNNDQGNFIIRIVNRGGIKAFVPYFPTEINDFQLNKIKEYFKEFIYVYDTLDESNKAIYKEGLDEMEKQIDKFEKKDSEHHTRR